MKSQNYDSKNESSHASFGEIRDEINNINSLMIYFKNAFSPNAFDYGIEVKRDFLEKKLLQEFKNKENITNELISHLATAMAVAEKERVVSSSKCNIGFIWMKYRFPISLEVK